MVTQALASAYKLARERTSFEKTELIIEDVPVVVYCPNCQAERNAQSPEWFTCPVCNAATCEIVSGRELEVRALELAT